MDIILYAKMFNISDVEKFLTLIKVGERTLREEMSSSNKPKPQVGSALNK